MTTPKTIGFFRGRHITDPFPRTYYVGKRRHGDWYADGPAGDRIALGAISWSDPDHPTPEDSIGKLIDTGWTLAAAPIIALYEAGDREGAAAQLAEVMESYGRFAAKMAAGDYGRLD